MDRKGAVDFLHSRLGYSRRMSSKLADIAFLSKSSNPFGVAIKEAIEKAMKKEK